MAAGLDFRRLALELSRPAFTARWDHPFLVFGEVDDELNLEFETRNIDYTALAGPAVAEPPDLSQTLTPRERKVLELRFGLEDGRSRTLEEVGREFNVTRERIRQIEAKALRKLRHPTRSKKLRDYLD